MQVSKYCLFIYFLFIALNSFSQDSLTISQVPAMRQLHHAYIARSLQQIDSLKSGSNEPFDAVIDQSAIQINRIKYCVESMEEISQNDKYRWLRGINELLTGFLSVYRSNPSFKAQYANLVNVYEMAFHLALKGESIEPLVKTVLPDIGVMLINNFALNDNSGITASEDWIVFKKYQAVPEKILSSLSGNPNNRYADSLIYIAGIRNPEELYRYAAVPDKLGKLIQQHPHPFIHLVAQLAATPLGRMYFPFLDNLYTGEITVDSIAPYISIDSSAGYYQLLVRTKLRYAERIRQGDTVFAMEALNVKLKSKAMETFVNVINALHDQPNLSLRFKCLENLSPVELYYLAVFGADELYTSSFVKGIYPRIFSRMRIPRSDSLLKLVNYDHYKKFIKISAAYNLLDDFLSRMSYVDAEKIIINFVDDLEKPNSLEDAVDVAETYASIANPAIRQLILLHIQHELNRCKLIGSEKGTHIYSILNLIFQSISKGGKTDLYEQLGIFSVEELPLKSLRDSQSGKIAIQQFFYGDKDGLMGYQAFLQKFKNPAWRIIQKKYWVEVNSVKGVPITIYANLPLNELEELDEKAQDSLIEYFGIHQISPSIVIHRGHSYYVNHTIKRLSSDAKLVILGSCGGYQKLNEIFEICPGAHIISSKQIGTGAINQQLVYTITETLRNAQSLNWRQIWAALSIQFKHLNKDQFDDYIPPYKNLGAIFILAYQKKTEQNY